MRLLELVAGPATRPEARRGDPRASATSSSARASSTARTRRASSPTASAPSGSRAATREAFDARADGRGGRRGRRQAVRLPEDRRLRPARPGRHRPRPARRRVAARDAAGRRRLLARSTRGAPLIDEDDRRRLHRPQGQGRLLPHGRLATARRSSRRSISKTGEYRDPVEAAAGERRARRQQGRSSARLLEHPDRAVATPGRCSRRRSPTPLDGARRSPTRSSRSTRRCAPASAGSGARSSCSTRSDRPGSPAGWRPKGWRCRRSCARGRRRHLLSRRGRPARSSCVARPAATSRRPRGRGRAAARRRQARRRSRWRRTRRPRSGTSATASSASSSPPR